MPEAQIRLLWFIGLFAVMATLELLAPRREGQPLKVRRWATNWAIVIIDSAIVRLLFKTAAVGGAVWAAQSGIGLFNVIAAPYWLAIAFSFAVLDFAVWFEHWVFHRIPFLWRIHRMHHSDVAFDVTTAIRFHPLEIVLSMCWKYLAVLALGSPAAAVLIFEIALNGGAMFNHSNFKLPLWVDRWLRLFIVTPDMHRVHHSVDRGEHNSNFGFNLSIWDRIFATYTDQPALGHGGMKIGLHGWLDERPAGLIWTLMVPFRK